ncbi:hypothetical protein [Novosphingobium sp.]|uniref:hypothetical protein n=1 Tax=Novosphingobium sp. TaxID=1874826 RepID=UPI00286D898D|nr:hypothetical protein [Novosphingobium sp.]
MTFADWNNRIMARLAFDMIEAGVTPRQIAEAREDREIIEAAIGEYCITVPPKMSAIEDAVRPVLRVVAGRDVL